MVSTFANGTTVPAALVAKLSGDLGISPIYKQHGYRKSIPISAALTPELELTHGVSCSQVPRDRPLARILLLPHLDDSYVLGLASIHER